MTNSIVGDGASLLAELLWDGDGKYALFGECGVTLTSVSVYHFVSPLAAMGVLGSGLLGLMYIIHTKWMAEALRNDDGFNGRPIINAALGVALVYIFVAIIILTPVSILTIITL